MTSQVRILLITDESDLGRDLVPQLSRLGYEAVVRSSGNGTPVTLAAEFRPDLVLLDLPPDGPPDGIAAARLIRERLALPVVLLTGTVHERNAELESLAHDYGSVPKPCDPRELRLVLAFALRQHRTELRLQRSEERMQAMLSTSMDSFWVVDLTGRVSEVNDTTCRITGYSREELLQMSIIQLEHGRTQAQVVEGIEAVIRTGACLIERQIIRKDGQVRTVEMSITCQTGPERLLYCFGRDVTERRQDEARLRQLTRAVEQSPASIVISDTSGRIEYVNPHFERLTGYTAAEAIGQNPRILKSGSQSPEFYRDLWQALTSGQTWSGEFHNRRKDGTFFWEKASISPMRNPEGLVTHYIAVKEDITVQKQIGFDLARRESYLSAIIENHNGLVWLKDCAGRYLAVNRALARSCGVADPALIIGKTDFDLWPWAAAVAYRDGDHRIMELGHGITLEEQLQINGQTVWFETFKTVVLDAAGLIIGTAGQATDITERRRAQHELIQAKEKAETASRAKSAFLAAMSHELRTPLNVINGIAATLLEQKLDPAHRQALELSMQGGQNLLTIIEEILDFSVLQAGKSCLDLAPFELAPLLHQVMSQAAELSAARKLTLTVSYDPALPSRINGDSRRLRQVLLNLVSNAVKFTERGAVHLVVRPQRGVRGRPSLHFSVVDTGIGIDPAHQDLIFQPFAQADGSIKRRFGGTGLGLAISRSYIRLMGGELRLRSRLEVGSVFHFNLPYDPVPYTMGILSGKGLAALRGERLLIAVSIGKRRRMLGAYARAWGMHVTLIDPAKATVSSLAAAAPAGFALIEAAAVTPGSPLRAWLDCRRASRPLPLVWLVRPDLPVPDGAGTPVKLLPCPVDPATMAREFANLLEGSPEAGSPAHPAPALLTTVPLAQRIPLTILVADDVQSNRQVLGVILRHLGYECNLVENGAEVLTALSAHRYDVVLLDVQMPVMDGLTAAREIHRLYPNASFRPKIVALTANALQGDREKCAAAGMDDYLAKPVVPATLAACLQKLFSGKSLPAPPPAASPSVDPTASPVWIDVAHLQAITQGLTDGQAAATLDGIHTSASADFAAVFPRVQAACAAHDPEALHRAVHGLKGCFQMLGWLRAAAGCVQALSEIRLGGFTRWTTFPGELLTLYQTSHQEMTRHIDTRAPLTAHPV